MTFQTVPINFAKAQVTLSWADLLWAYERALISWKDVVETAREKVDAGSINVPETQLAEVDKTCIWRVADLLPSLAEGGGNGIETSKRKWLFLSLAWLFERLPNLPKPLDCVEAIYADFDYPPSIESFVAFLPPTDGHNPALHSPAENFDRLITKWKDFIRSEKLALAAPN